MTRNPLTFFVFLACLFAAGAYAQEEATAFDISLANPGARSMGFGGAFVPLADDATATFANPAGLAQFLEPELTFEVRIQGIRNAGVSSFRSDDDTTVLAFLAFVYPWKRGALAVYHNGFGNLAIGRRLTGQIDGRAFDVGLSDRIGIQSAGLSASYRLTENLSIGAGVALWDGDLTSTRQSTLAGDGLLDPGESRRTTLVTTDGNDLTFNAGFLWRFADQWRLGGVYRGAPEFVLRGEVFRQTSAVLPLSTVPTSVRQFPFLLPDVIGLGVAFKTPGETLTLSFEWDLVRYSRLLDSFDSPNRASFDLDDAHELHFGFEYVIVRSRPVIALRLGTWLEPDHLLRYSGNDLLDRATFRGGDEVTHFSMGLGFAFKSLKLDLAFDESDVARAGSFTLIYSF